jgi:hypothetical protein
VFLDMNGNSTFDAGEPTISGWRLQLSGPVSANVMSDGFGAFSFTALPPGTYTLCATVVPGFTPVAPTSGPACTTGLGWSLTIPSATPDLILRDINFGYRM